jgi:hypothetical protein
LQKKRAALNQATEHLFPALCVLGTKLLEHLNFKSGEMVKTIAKIFCASIRVIILDNKFRWSWQSFCKILRIWLDGQRF